MSVNSSDNKTKGIFERAIAAKVSKKYSFKNVSFKPCKVKEDRSKYYENIRANLKRIVDLDFDNSDNTNLRGSFSNQNTNNIAVNKQCLPLCRVNISESINNHLIKCELNEISSDEDKDNINNYVNGVGEKLSPRIPCASIISGDAVMKVEVEERSYQFVDSSDSDSDSDSISANEYYSDMTWYKICKCCN